MEYPLAEQALARLGEDPPDDDELDEVWPVGDLDLFADLDLAEDEMEQILDDMDAYPDEMLDAIVERLGLDEAYARRDRRWRGPVTVSVLRRGARARAATRWRGDEVDARRLRERRRRRRRRCATSPATCGCW